jgi:murein DD-endopeptidase MepM/ murein hydrolase activator NlpD
LARVRGVAVAVMIALLLAEARVRVLPVPWAVVWVAAMILILVVLRSGTLRRPSVPLQVPVAGRWKAFNSPASRVPSHGVQSYGQAYAVDLVNDPPGGRRPGFGWWPPARRPEDFPGFGTPVHAPCAGTVVRVHDRERDHRSRTSPFGLVYLFTVELVRELFGPSRVLGNHVVIDRDGEGFVVLAHLRRGSVRVAAGDRLTAGEEIAECGNSGNSSEPHLHLQLMDRPRSAFAAGLPFHFVAADGSPVAMPRNGGELPDEEPARPLALRQVSALSSSRASSRERR